MRNKLTTACIAMFVLFLGMAQAAPMKVTVDKVQGTVQVQSGSGWVALKSGATVPVGAEVKTAASSSCILKWAGGNVLKVGPMSTVSVAAEKTAAGDEKSKVNLKQGKVSAHAKKLSTGNSSFNIQTPTAVAGVRGTDIIAEIEAGNVTFGVSDGQLEMTIGDEVFVLEDGFLVNVDPEGEFTEPIPIPPAMMEDIKAEFDALKQEAAIDAEAGGDGEGDDGETTDSDDTGDDTDQDLDSVSEDIDSFLDNEVNSDIVDTASDDYVTGEVEIHIYLENYQQ